MPNFDPESFEWAQLKDDEQSATVRFLLHSLKWIDQLIADGITHSETSAESKHLAYSVARQWWLSNRAHPEWAEDEYVWGGHGFALRTTTLVALSEIFPDETWLYEALAFHRKELTNNFDGYWNHGLVQAIALMCVASRFDDREGIIEGATRATDCLEVMVDGEGCINEQAPEYARYIERLIRVVIEVFHLNNIEGIEVLEEKKILLREFIAHSLTPDYKFIELGDSVPRTPPRIDDTPIEYVMTNGTKGAAIPKVKVYEGGFIFGRSGFGITRPIAEESYYTVRFGPQRIIHGHNDHLSMTYWNDGRAVIVDPGHSGYTPGTERNYVRSHAAHNVPFIVGEKHDWSAYTKLRSKRVEDSWQAFQLEDPAYANFHRRRTMFFSDCGPFAVLDSIRGTETAQPRYITQRWNIAPEFELSSANAEAVIFQSKVDGTRFHLIRYLINGQNSIHGQTALDLHKGDRAAMLGFVAQHETLAPSWNVGFGVTGLEARILTVGFTSAVEDEVGWSFRSAAKDKAVLRVHIGSHSWAINVDYEKRMLSGRAVPSEYSIYRRYGIGDES